MNGLKYAIEYMKLRILYLDTRLDLLKYRNENPHQLEAQHQEAKALLKFLEGIHD